MKHLIILLIAVAMCCCNDKPDSAKLLDDVYCGALRVEKAMDMAGVDDPSQEAEKELDDAIDDLKAIKSKAHQAGVPMKDILASEREGREEFEKQADENYEAITGEKRKR